MTRRSRVEADLLLKEALKDALSGSDMEAVKSATEKLAVGVQELGKQLYEQACGCGQRGSAGGSSAGGTSSGPAMAPGQPVRRSDDEVVDAEIVDEGQGADGAYRFTARRRASAGRRRFGGREPTGRFEP